MNIKFANLVEAIAPKLERLLSMPPSYGDLPRDMPRSGIYLFSENERHLYIGRSNSMRQRYSNHCAPCHRKAAFAYRLAREATGNTKASYRPGAKSRDGLRDDPLFEQAFQAALQRVRRMAYRYVEETDQNRQALLEIYCAVALETPYNDFGTR